jgi:hypothetical protein
VATHEIVEAVGENGGAPKELCHGCQHKYTAGVSPGIDNYTVASYLDADTNQCVAPAGVAKPHRLDRIAVLDSPLRADIALLRADPDALDIFVITSMIIGSNSPNQSPG